jgi:hypothetical protein
MAEHSDGIRISIVAAQAAATYAAVSVKTFLQRAASETPVLLAGVFTDRRDLLLRARLAALVRPPLHRMFASNTTRLAWWRCVAQNAQCLDQLSNFVSKRADHAITE